MQTIAKHERGGIRTPDLYLQDLHRQAVLSCLCFKDLYVIYMASKLKKVLASFKVMRIGKARGISRY